MENSQFYSFLKNTDTLNADSLQEVRRLTNEYPWFQTGWLLYLKNLKNQNCQEYKNILNQVAVMVPDRKILFKFLNSELPKTKPTVSPFELETPIYKLEATSNINKKGDSLINKFLSAEKKGLNKITTDTNKAEVLKIENIAEKSAIANNEIVTEMLASIYFQQQKYDEALDAYEKLSLKYPEKNVYFASRIKEIKEIKNNN